MVKHLKTRKPARVNPEALELNLAITTTSSSKFLSTLCPGGGVLYIFWVRGRAIGKGIDFREFGIRNGIDFHDFGIRNGIDFFNFRNWYGVGYVEKLV